MNYLLCLFRGLDLSYEKSTVTGEVKEIRLIVPKRGPASLSLWMEIPMLEAGSPSTGCV